ncbi:Dolichyl-phosphate-mannose-protein mannosyltransferase-domain-containing protein [Obelidium mucronatum]|nr:Dolichyl-phosphate-mannose-protein mannosyltransferase-domain-containing protein [Obelidium mucronatum]
MTTADFRQRNTSHQQPPSLMKKSSYQGISLPFESKGSLDPFDSEQKYKKINKEAKSSVPLRANAVILGVLSLLALFTRLFQIGKANTVVWDEAHFGKFAGFYQTRKWYTDLHPPLGKSMLGLFANFVGFDGLFEFDSGATYPNTLYYTPIRACCAILAAATVPLAYLTGLELHLSQDAAVFLGVMALTDVATLVLSRFILLDPLLLFFTSLSLFSLFRFRNFQKNAPFSQGWYFWMAATGFSIGCCMSVKWVGLFVVAVVGLHTANDLFAMLYNGEAKPLPYILHWLTRIAFLIILPLSVYLAAFSIHFSVLTHSGPGDSKMGSLFQYHLIGSDISTGPVNIAYGSEVQIRYHGAGGGILHSHPHNYPIGSKEQQVTLYGFRHDENNRFVFLEPTPGATKPKDKKIIKNGDVVRIQHRLSGKNLRSHSEYGAPTSGELYREVSFGGSEKEADELDLWKIIVVDDLGKWKGPLRTLTTRFRIKHVKSGCFLRSDHMTKLDKNWGFEQQEVACTLDSINWENSRNSLWNIEEHWNPELPPATKKDYPWNFFSSFMDDNYDKILGNSMLVPEPGKVKSSIESYPWEWPTLQTNLVIGGAGYNYNILGLPLIWLGVSASLVVYVVTAATYLIRWKFFKITKDFKTAEQLDDFFFMFKIGIVGWLVNFIPYILMPRVTYIHHYLPALQFGMILFAYMVEHLVKRVFVRRTIVGRAVIWGFIAVDLLMFWYFKEFAFGYKYEQAAGLKGRMWFKAWRV